MESFCGDTSGEKDHLKDPSLDGRILKFIFKEWARPWIGLIWLRRGTGGGFCECCNALPAAVRCKECLG